MTVAKITFQPIQVDTGSADGEGRLVLIDAHLVAVLVRLDGEEHGALRGSWHMEAGFGSCDTAAPGVFPTLQDAEAWALEQVSVVHYSDP